MAHLSIRLPETTLKRFDALAAERGLTRARLLRQLINGVLDGAPVGAADTPSEEELVELLSEKARAGNVSAIRSLLARTDETDPRDRALLALKALAEERQP
jgi:Ribbon-helix-helix protein, copG family